MIHNTTTTTVTDVDKPHTSDSRADRLAYIRAIRAASKASSAWCAAD